MSFLADDDDHNSPWGAAGNDEPEPSPWGESASDQEQEQPEIATPPASVYDESPYVDSSQLLGASTHTQGLNYVETPKEAKAETPKKSPRRGRSSKIKKTVTEVQRLDAGPLAMPEPTKTSEAVPTSLFESVTLEEPPKAAEEFPEETEVSVPSDDQLELAGELKINVEDPSRVGDITSTHIVYTINTNTDLPEFSGGRVFSVQRRYRDFRWLYKALVSNNPGCIVPPTPAKQVFGTMNDEFIESRRASLELMLYKISRHPILRVDADLTAFLSHDDFGEYLKSRIITDEELEAVAVSGSGFLGLSVFARSDESDGWLADQRAALDILEVQLRGLSKALDLLHTQRKDLATTLQEFANVTTALASVEPTRKLEVVLRSFAKVNTSLSELYVRQRQQDTLFIESTVDEQLRLVDSVRDACNARQRLQVAALTARQDGTKREQALERARKAGNDEKIQLLEQETTAALAKAQTAEELYSKASERVEHELSRVEKEKVAEFRNAVELFLENAVESQKHAIELWETFYTRHISTEA